MWVFLFRASFLNPVNQGGWPTRLGLLRRPEVVADVIAELDRRAGDTPPAGFAAACLVNLTIAAGDYDRARALLAALEGDAEERFLYDLAAHNARQLALTLRAGQGDSPELAAFLLDLQAHATGLPVPAAGPAADGEREGR